MITETENQKTVATTLWFGVLRKVTYVVCCLATRGGEQSVGMMYLADPPNGVLPLLYQGMAGVALPCNCVYFWNTSFIVGLNR